MQRLEVSCAVRHIYTSLGAKGLISILSSDYFLKESFFVLKTVLVIVNYWLTLRKIKGT